MPATIEKREPGAGSFIIAALFNVVMLLLINAHASWRPLLGGIVTEAFADALWVMNLGCAVQIVGNLLMLADERRRLRRAIELVFNVVALLGAVVMFRVYPFDFSRFDAWVNVTARVLMVLGIVGASIALVVTLVRFVAGDRGSRHRPAHP